MKENGVSLPKAICGGRICTLHGHRNSSSLESTIVLENYLDSL